MTKLSYRIINGITLYRVLAAPVLIVMIFTNQLDIFKWLLAFSFFTDLIDGFLARKFKVTSILGSRLDSIGDDLTVLAAILALFIFRMAFIRQQMVLITVMLSLFLLQNLVAILKYRKITSFHTYLAKISAILQGLFLIPAFFLSEPIPILFYIAAIVTTLELIEEIILVIILPEWKANVRGLYWVIEERKNSVN